MPAARRPRTATPGRAPEAIAEDPAGRRGPWRTDPEHARRWGPAVAHLVRVDPDLAALVRRVGPCTLAPDGADDPFSALVETIVYQQLSGKAARTIFDRLLGLVKRLDPPRLARTSDETLRRAGLSRPKIRSIRDLVARVREGRLDLTRLNDLPDEKLASELLAVKGIGPWSVQMYLIFRLGRPDVWPTLDLGIRKGARLVWGLDSLPSPAELESRGERLRPHRTVASWYLWRSLELPKTRRLAGSESQDPAPRRVRVAPRARPQSGSPPLSSLPRARPPT